MRIKTLTIVGVGLIGGSIGLAAKSRRVTEHVAGASRQEARPAHAVDIGGVGRDAGGGRGGGGTGDGLLASAGLGGEGHGPRGTRSGAGRDELLAPSCGGGVGRGAAARIARTDG